MQLSDLSKIKLLGKGGSAEVYLIKDRNTELNYAMKIAEKVTGRAIKERNILKALEHPFIIPLIHDFQDDDYIYMILPHCEKGDLYEYMKKQKGLCFNEIEVKYYASCILLAIQYLHFMGVVYRDLKLENILLLSSSKIMLSDFDLSFMHNDVVTKSYKKIGTVSEPNVTMYEKNGTLEYLAPEMVQQKPYTCMVDWWSFGILLYEMTYGKTPFVNPSVEKTYLNISEGNLLFAEYTPKDRLISKNVKNIIKKLLKLQPNERLGYKGGALEIQCHLFFQGVNFYRLYDQNPSF
jgi:protein-serine/threonine kinase